jgi:hypothetical protein
MAVIGGGSAGAKAIFDAVIDNDADRLLHVQDQVGPSDTWAPAQGLIQSRIDGFESLEIEVDPMAAADGQTFGDQRLVSAAGLFRADMVGQQLVLEGMRRTITTFTSATEVELSGEILPADTGQTYSIEAGMIASPHELAAGAQVVDGRLVQAASGRLRMLWRVTSP